MRFGTLQSIEKEPSNTGDELEISKEMPSEFDMDDADELDDELDPLQAILDKLADLKMEIDSILTDMGYGDDQFDDHDDVMDQEDAFPEDMEDDDLDASDDNDFEFEFDHDDNDDEGEQKSPFDDGQLDGDETAQSELPNEQNEDPDFQGNIRTVAGADLVYKRKEEDGNYEELWIYNVGKDVKKEMQIRRAILAGTDIVPSQTESEDGIQHSETYTVGNVQYLKISGLPN